MDKKALNKRFEHFWNSSILSALRPNDKEFIKGIWLVGANAAVGVLLHELYLIFKGFDKEEL